MYLPLTPFLKHFVQLGVVFFFANSIYGQICPALAHDYSLVRSTYANWTINNLTCKPRDEGGTMCWVVCAYSIPGADAFYTQAMWYTTASPHGPYYSEMCKPNANDRTLSNDSKQIKVFWGDVDNGKELDAARWVARQLFSTGEQQAVPCTNSPVQAVDRSACQTNHQRLRILTAHARDVEDQIAYLNNHRQKEEGFRNNLSYYSILIAALNTTNYNGEFRQLVNDLRTKPETRAAFANEYGIDSSLDAITILRSVRDIMVARIEYLVDAPVFLQRLRDEKALNEFEVAKLRSGLVNAGCPGEFSMKGCDMSGRWAVTDQAPGAEAWNFNPRTDGKYDAEMFYPNGQRSAMKANVEVYGDEVILRYTEGDSAVNISGRYKFKMNDTCTYGTGTSRMTARAGEVNVTISRDNQGVRKFVNNAMYFVEYLGKVYTTIYERGSHNGIPIDTFFFKITEATGEHVRQDGQELWGRFVRNPALDHPNQSNIETWFVTWNRRGNRWINEERKNEVFVVR